MNEIKKAVVAISDFTSGVEMINQMVDFFDDWVTELHLIIVLEKENIQHLSVFRKQSYDEVLKQSRLENENIMSKLITTFSDSHFLLTSEIEEGIVGEVIIGVSKKQKADFIVMGTKREKISKRLLKNHVRFVIELSEIPVFLFPI